MSDVDEALVDEIVDLLASAHGWEWDFAYTARAIIERLAATGRLVGEGEGRVEWELFDPKYTVWKRTSAQTAAAAPRLGWRRRRRTVRTWATSDGSTGTLVGPWVEVQP